MPPSSDTPGALRVVGLMCLAEVLSMTGFAAYPAFLALLRDTWGISNSEAGFIGGAFFGGYMIAVPILSSLTDRFDARRVYMLSCALSGVSAVGLRFSPVVSSPPPCSRPSPGRVLPAPTCPG